MTYVLICSIPYLVWWLWLGTRSSLAFSAYCADLADLRGEREFRNKPSRVDYDGMSAYDMKVYRALMDDDFSNIAGAFVPRGRDIAWAFRRARRHACIWLLLTALALYPIFMT